MTSIADPPIPSTPVALGNIVGSTSHTMLEARIYDASQKAAPPQPADFAFGTFVGIQLPGSNQAAFETKIEAATPPMAIGVIANSRLLNPDEGYAGPRLTVPPSQNQLFAPDYLHELGIHISILIVGTLFQEYGEQSIVREVIPVGSEVSTITARQRYQFHHAPNGAFQMRYSPRLQEVRPGLSLALLQIICEQLTAHCDPQEQRMMQVLRKHIAWQSMFQSMT